MLTMTFEEFERGEWADGKEQECSIYVIKDGETFLYIGKTRQHVLDRWFGACGHMPYGDYEYRSFFSTIGRRIADNMPDSKKYTVELYSLEEAKETVRAEIEERNFCYDRIGLGYCEQLMILKHKPFDNTTYNPSPQTWQGKEDKLTFREPFNVGLFLEEAPNA